MSVTLRFFAPIAALSLILGWLVWNERDGIPGSTEQSVGKAEESVEGPSAAESGLGLAQEDVGGAVDADSGRFGTGTLAKADFQMAFRVSQKLEVEDGHEHHLGSWLGALEPSPADWDLPPGALSGEGLRVDFDLPDGESVQLLFERAQGFGTRRAVYSGRLAGQTHSQALFSSVGTAVAGALRLPAQGVAWEIRNKGDGVQEFEKVDLSKLRTCSVCQAEAGEP